MQGRRIIVGKVGGVYGVRGWIKVRSYTRPRDNILTYSPWFLRCGGRWRECAVGASRTHGKSVLANLAEVADRDGARELIDADIAVAHRQLPALAEGRYYWCDLIGLEVVDQHDTTLGKVTDIVETGANDVLIVEGDRKWLIPYVCDVYIIAVDLQQCRIRVDWETNAAD